LSSTAVDLNFDDVPEHRRTKHVHRLHPYLGKFIPQLVEWFLARYFRPDDIILDPFMGSGTTLIQGHEMGIHTIGIDISPFNCLIARVKADRYHPGEVRREVTDIERHVTAFSKRLTSPALPLFDDGLDDSVSSLLEECTSAYLKAWFAPRALLEILAYRRMIPRYYYQDLLRVILSRSARSSRLVPHDRLADQKTPLQAGKEYWCRKHRRLCVPVDTSVPKIRAYSSDTLRRIAEFSNLRSDKTITIIQGDARTVDLHTELHHTPASYRLIDGIFTSPPYLGMIDYHDQHTYAYELFGFQRFDHLEIGPKKRGQSQQAKHEYIDSMIKVLRNVLPFVKYDGKIFVVVNDRFNLYPEIAAGSGLKIVDQLYRDVTRRTRSGNAYQEAVLVMMRDTEL